MRFSLKAQSRLVLLLGPALTILVVGFAASFSLLLGLLALFLVPAILMVWGHNYERVGGKLRESNDAFMLEFCETGAISSFRRLYRHLPASPRCRLCLVPFGGFGRLLRIMPSRKNPNFCGSCIDGSPEGVHDMEVGVLFADIRGFTAWSSAQPASAAAKRISEFYDLAGRVLMQDDALVEFVGDQVMALYLPGFPSLGEGTADTMLSAAERLASAVQQDPVPDPLQIGVGLNYGIGSIGNVRKGAEKDFTAVGDVVNTAARLQGAAGPGEIVVAKVVFDQLTTPPAAAEHRLLQVKGKSEPLPVYVLEGG